MLAEAAAQVLSSVESEIGRTTDPVRMYMREMGTVELLTREGEIDIAQTHRRRHQSGAVLRCRISGSDHLTCLSSTTALKRKKPVCPI
ncbi:RNA polymerase sigma factor RpoD [Klebsiella pneumoniae]|uniref:RNA polymerase sigma factor RpoD n=1 Tax=Klebsiella pneumoniae TaxID=573 RepID=A0A2X3EM00_KLEPN|nr:RNA polymerase sigma factor RpoD [Klebsiella pneumoniae]